MVRTSQRQDRAEEATIGERAVIQPAKWYLRTTADRDTHRGRLFRDGTVIAECGVVFRPVEALRARGPALPGAPPDPDQVCPQCQRGRRSR